jgi:hypothetical protein
VCVSHHRCRNNAFSEPSPCGTQIASYCVRAHVHRHGFMLEISDSHHRCLQNAFPEPSPCGTQIASYCKNAFSEPSPCGTQIASYCARSHVHRHGFMMEMIVSHHRFLQNAFPEPSVSQSFISFVAVQDGVFCFSVYPAL